MKQLPRLSGALRAFSDVGYSQQGNSDTLSKELLEKRQLISQSKTEGITWESLTSTINKEADADKGELSKTIKDLQQCARNIVGSEASSETVESGAAFLFDVFKDVDKVGNTQTAKLRNIFGPFPATAATKACILVNRIVSWLPEESSLLLGNQDREEGDGEATVHEFGKGIKFVNPKCDVIEDFSESETDDEDENKREITDLKYLEPPSQKATQPKTQEASERFDESWLQLEMSKYYTEEDTGLSLEDLCSTVFDVLTSTKSDTELQNDLFELLGFDRFELIQSLIQNRQQIIKAAFVAEEAAKNRKKDGAPGRPTYGCQVTIQSEDEKKMMKLMRKADKRGDGQKMEEGDAFMFDPKALRAQREAALLAAASAPILPSGRSYKQPEKYPNVYDSMAEARQSSAYIAGVKMLLSDNFRRNNTKIYEEVIIPHTETAPANVGKERVPVEQLDEIGQIAFKGTKSLNRIQSVVFEAAYKTNENLLICAPTGAGKTNIAMLTILHELKQHISQGVIKKDEFKIIYVAPMKALAAEMVRNFGARLEPLGISVRELTGDMSLTKAEILKTQMMVTTPEKWDVVTRKSTGDVALAQLVKLLIIDEVHLLHDDRGSVIESLVARTIRQVESTQNMIRIIGLSATLPNYLDVARFLHVNPYQGLFFFDGRFRPVPLGQTFVGVKSTNRVQQLQDMNTVCYEKVLEQVRKGYQTMVFVHARNDTVRTAMVLRDLAKNKNDIGFFLPEQSRQFGEALKSTMKSRNRQLKELFPDGFAIHHAGMLRQDRNLVEKYFAAGLIKCLVCTATLAWGVNLPAHAVMIKGTQIYDAKKGSFVDLGILDVMQIFGRAGRPQFDQFGEGTIITSHDKLSHYLSLMTRQNPIESQFVNSLTDNLNAEISLGTVTNVEEAVKWLSYTYLYVRMRCNPLVYGINYNMVEVDPMLEAYRKELITDAGRKLDKAQMVRFDERTGYFASTDLGRIASHFYIKYDTVEIINENLKTIMTEADIFAVVSKAQEFDQIKVREDEMQELDSLLNEVCVMQVPGGVENTYGKVNILMQAFVARQSVDSFSLVSDQAYVAQNAGRIIRALFEITLKKSWPIMASRLLNLCKTIDKRLWGFENPLRQFFPTLSQEILRKIEDKKLTVDKLKEMDHKEIGHMVHHIRMGSTIKKCVNQIPCLDLDATIQPITRTVLRVRLTITPEFNWDDKVHGTSSEPFWIWVEDPDNNHIYHSEYFLLNKKQVQTGEAQNLVFTIPIFEPLPTQYYVKAISDRWLGSQFMCPISFQHLILPERHPPHTELLDLQPLPITALNDHMLETLYSFTHFNPIQTQIFHCLYHTDKNVLLGAPTGSGKTIAAEMAIFRVFREYPNHKAVYIAPLKALVRERMEDWKVRIEQKLGKKVVELTGDVTPDMRAIAGADLIVTTPEKWDGVSRSWQTRNYVKAVAVLIIDEIHLLGNDRGPVLEVIVSRTNFISSHTTKPVRVVGLSTALANAKDLADWLAIGQMGLYNFRPSVRPVPLEVHIHGFPGQHYCPRMATMNKPTFQAVKTHSPDKPVLIFVSSRRQTRLTALDLIAFLASEDNPKQWLHMEEMEWLVDQDSVVEIMRRSKNTYFYMVTISMLYFVMILLLHSRLQGEICQMQIVYKYPEIHNHTSIPYHHISVRNNSFVQNLNNRTSCHPSPESRDFRFQTVADDFFFVYTAYLDKRLNTTFIRIMSVLLRGNKNKVVVVCTVKKSDGMELDIEAVKYEMCENHNKKFGGWIMSCPLPKDFTEPCDVKVSIYQKGNHQLSSNNITLKLIKILPSSANKKYTVCVPPLFGKVNFSRLIEFMEFTKYFGAEKFIFYDHAINDEKSLKALEYYTNKNLVTTIPWKLPEFIRDPDIWYHGQLIAHNDCLYRAMSLTDILAIQDIDELIVPHDGNALWEESLTPLFNSNVVGLGIHSAFFETKFDGDILAINSIKRTKTFSRFRTKVLVKPSAIFEVGIHHVSKPLLEKYKIISPDTKIVILHHYRNCLSNYGMNCKDWVVDKTIKIKYGHIQNQIFKIKSDISKLVSNKPVNAQVVNVTMNKLLT